MNHWAYVTGAYAAAVVITALLLSWSWNSMRRAEDRAERLKRPDAQSQPEGPVS